MLDMKEKNKISHRGKALRDILKKIDENYSDIFKRSDYE